METQSPQGLVRISDYEALLQSKLFLHMEKSSNNFIAQNSETLSAGLFSPDITTTASQIGINHISLHVSYILLALYTGRLTFRMPRTRALKADYE